MSRTSPRPRSLVLDLFGDYLRFVDAEVRLGHLTRLLADFEVAPATVRMTMSRLRREGWFTTRRSGRETIYRLSGTMLGVLDEGRRRIFAPPTTGRVAGWTMVIYQLSEEERQEREQLRKRLAWQGFGQLTTSTWLAWGDRRAEVAELVSGLAGEHVDVLRCQSDGLVQDRDLAARCWDLPALAAGYEEFNVEHRGLLDRARRLHGPQALVTRTLLVSRFRHFPFHDPQLPPELRPDRWPGEEAALLFRQSHEELGPAAREYVGEVVGREVIVPAASVAAE